MILVFGPQYITGLCIKPKSRLWPKSSPIAGQEKSSPFQGGLTKPEENVTGSRRQRDSTRLRSASQKLPRGRGRIGASQD